MDEPVLYNHSPFEADVLPICDRDGAPARVAIIKATYAIKPADAALVLSPEPRGIRLGDVVWGPPEVPDIRLPGDFCAAKPGTDFVLAGHAVPMRSSAGRHTDVGIRVADRVLLLRVHGPRCWQRSLRGVAPGASREAERTPLAWSRAYGGIDLSDPARPIEEARNPVGSGVTRHAERLIGLPAPQIEAPGSPIGCAGDRHVPAGCAALGRSFEPRRRYAGTYDGRYIRHVYPARPPDYEDRHENCAVPGLLFEQSLRGGERVRLTGVHADSVLDFALPKWQLIVDAQIDGSLVERRPHLDTIVVDSDALTLELVWRALYRCPAKMHRRFTAIRVQAREFLG